MGHSSYKSLSHDIQNEIDILGKSVLCSIVREMKIREHFAIMVDKTCDISIYERVTCIHFKTLWDCMKIQTEGKTLFGIMKDILARLDLNIENLQGHCYDGTSAMSGKLKGLQKFVADLQQKAILSLSTLLYLVDNEASSIQQVLINYERLAECFETHSEEYSSDAASKFAGYLETMQHFRTFFFSSLYCHVMSPVEVNFKIQCPHIGVTEVESKLSYLIYNLEEKHRGYEQFWQKCLKEKPTHVEEPQMPQSRRIPKRLENPCATEPHIFFTPKDYQTRVCLFNCTGLQKLVSLEKECLSAVIAVNTTPKLEKTRVLSLLLHLTLLGDIAKRKSVAITSIHDIQEFLKEVALFKTIVPEVNRCINLLRTVPVTTVTAERLFSTLRHLKTYLRSTMAQKRLNSTAQHSTT
ncbi:hypothetical protein PR048_014220 [Dryococelus australis]|uniref:HAT C-terminal dimerisation domain-containing protein n=1 Tax=Dryococelus australis TaxID=614101 RepID=A0ABQ9HDT6_9NEOP|nr:hypothetical protein PR048_014220 [Dryococelus australis]